MKPKIKICGMKFPGNILEVLTLQPDYIGFIRYPASKRFIGDLDPDWVAGLDEVKKTGVFVDEEIAKVIDAVRDYHFQAIQLHGNESPSYCASLKGLNVEVVKAFGIDETFDWSRLNDYETVADYYLFDTQSSQYGGTGQVFDWDLLNRHPSNKPYFLSGGLHAGNIQKALQRQDNRLYALDLNSKFEISPGVKDIDLLTVTLQQIRNEQLSGK